MGRAASSPVRGPRVALAIALLALGLAALPQAGTTPAVAAANPLASVRYIKKGLSVQPPRHHASSGKVRQPLYSAYRLQTRRAQRASVAFRDGTILNMNQLTDATLRSASVTQVKSGEVAEQVTPGSNHRVQTPAAVASAIGTLFDVRVHGNLTVITVVEGAVLVTTAKGSVVVKSGEQIQIRKGQAPSAPAPVDAETVTAWNATIPPPAGPPGLNIALDANGGSVYAWSSQRGDANHAFDAVNANDGRLDHGWQSAAGQVKSQWLRVSFQGGKQYPISAVFLDCAATGGQDGGNAMNDFAILTSDSPDSGFTSVLTGSCAQSSSIQVFPLAASVRAAYLELDALDNHGGSDGIAVAELGVISSQEPAVLGTPTPLPSATATPTQVPSPTATPTATATSGPRGYMFGKIVNVQTSGDPSTGDQVVITDTYSGQVCGDPFTTPWTISVTRDVQAGGTENSDTGTKQLVIPDGSPTTVFTDQNNQPLATITWHDGSPPQMELDETSHPGYTPAQQSHFADVVPNPNCP